MGRGGVKTFEGLVDEVGDHSPVDGSPQTPVVVPRSAMSRSVPLKDLVGNPHNPRDSVGDLSDLASIAEFQLQPVVAVSRAAFQAAYPGTEVSARWVVILGNRRLAAAHKFGRSELDIVIRDDLAADEASVLTAVISENVDRKGFDVIEEAKAVERLVSLYASADLAGEHLRKSKTWISQRRALLKLAPDLQQALRRGDLAIREARDLARVPLEQQVARWNAARNPLPVEGNASGDDQQGSDSSNTAGDSGSHSLRSVTRAIRKFDAEPRALALALRDELGESGTKTLINQLRKL